MRILLSDSYLDPTNPRDNTYTIEYVNEIASRERLDLQARLFRSDLAALDKIHNKGIIADGRRVLVSSINWSYNSPANNREVGLLLDHPALGAYYTDIFTYNWYNGSPADYPLITEVEAAAGFVEIVHVGPQSVDLGGWRLVTPHGSLSLPPRRLEPGRPLVLARDLTALKGRYGLPQEVLHLPELQVSGARGYVRLVREGRVVDQVAWGGAEPGWALPGPRQGALCRPEPGKDTNTYLDWQPAPHGSPGRAGCG